jgi:hypothetical protein
MKPEHDALLIEYLGLPDRLEAALAGLGESDWDLGPGEGWSIRQIVQHVADGELMLQWGLRSAVGVEGGPFPMSWYFALTQDQWAECWAYDRRPVDAALGLYRASTRALVELLRCLPDEVWARGSRVHWPGAQEETVITVREAVEINLRHLRGHIEDIRAIRARHSR